MEAPQRKRDRPAIDCEHNMKRMACQQCSKKADADRMKISRQKKKAKQAATVQRTSTILPVPFLVGYNS